MIYPMKKDLLILRRRQSLQSQMTIAAQLGISQAQYSLYEMGHRTPKREQAEKLIKMFGLPPDYFDEPQSEQEGA